MITIELGCEDAAGAGLVRQLHPLVLKEGPLDGNGEEGPNVGIVVDVETTGLDAEEDRVIELALRRFRFTDEGIITNVGKPYCWLEDPGRPIPEDIRRLTKLTDEMVAGQTIDEALATKLLRSSSLVIAHNAGFDRGWVEKRLPDAAGLPWACSMIEIDWLAHGYDGRKLGYLLHQAGYYHTGHRASADVDAVIQLLRQRTREDKPLFAHLLETSARPSWVVRAVGAAFSVKDTLRRRGYRWNGDLKVWWREIADKDRAAEEWWLASNVYGLDCHARSLGPEFVSVSAFSRFT